MMNVIMLSYRLGTGRVLGDAGAEMDGQDQGQAAGGRPSGPKNSFDSE